MQIIEKVTEQFLRYGS